MEDIKTKTNSYNKRSHRSKSSYSETDEKKSKRNRSNSYRNESEEEKSSRSKHRHDSRSISRSRSYTSVSRSNESSYNRSYRSRSMSRSPGNLTRHRKSKHHRRSRSWSHNSSHSYDGKNSRANSITKSRSPRHSKDKKKTKDPRDKSKRELWKNKVYIVGEIMKDTVFHFCDTCQMPIFIYCRLIPCKHIFCFPCGSKYQDKKCPRCDKKVNQTERCNFGTIYMCYKGGNPHGMQGCRRTYLSQRDLDSHINHRHNKTGPTPNQTVPSQCSIMPLPVSNPLNMLPPNFINSFPNQFQQHHLQSLLQQQQDDKSLNKADEESLESKLAKIAKTRGKKMKNGISKKKPSPTDSPIIETISKKVKGKENRKWTNEATGIEADALNYSKKLELNGNKEEQLSLQEKLTVEDLEELNKLKGRLEGQLADIEAESDFDSSEEGEEDYQKEIKTESKPQKKSNGMFSMLKSWVGVHGGVLTEEQMCPVLENLKTHLITKNVASEVALELCNGVAKKLVGKELGVLERVSTKLRESLEDSCRKLLNCGRRIDVLRDVIEAKRQGRPYVISFCGVNGVGKSTNLAKISFWLIEQGFRVMIAACDTFRSGAVEQLRVHVQKLNYIHPPEQHHGLPMVQLYEKGYGKDAAAVATYAISLAKEKHFDVVMIDTSGRMQDNEPLMRSLAKLINVNQPDLVLFVGEALVGHEAVDQLVKFNKALQDYSGSDHPRTINGIVLTKFDTIDDKVGAAISMTYILGQPIMFVGTGQTYADLRQLSPEAVVKSLMK